ncbi:MAG: hypothetical protein ACO3A4_04265 [Silvanigrellaceae bacterium]
MALRKNSLAGVLAVSALLASSSASAGGNKFREYLALDSNLNIPLTWLHPESTATHPRALVILQHGMMRNAEKMMALAQSLVERNIEVVLPGITDTQAMDPLFPELFANAFDKKQVDPAGRSLPNKILMAGFSAGARFLSHVAGLLQNKQRDIRGVVLMDPVIGLLPEQQLGPRLPIPYFTILAKPSRCNSDGNAFPLFESGQFETQGFRLKTASHCDFEGKSSDPLCYVFCGSSPRENSEVIRTFVTEWISGLVDSEKPHIDYLPGGKIFTFWQNQGLFDSIFK